MAAPLQPTLLSLRLLGAIAVAAVVLALLPAADAAAAGRVSIAAPAKVAAPSNAHFKVRASGVRAVALYVDGKRRWRRATKGRFGHAGVLHTRHLRQGRHRLTVRARRGGRVARATRIVRISRATKRPHRDAPSATPAGATGLLLDAGFENGLANWNTAGVGDIVPTVGGDVVRSGAKSARVALTGSQDRSELILGGDGGGSTDGTVALHDGDERYYAFSINVQQMVYGEPGAHNLIAQLKSDGEGSPNFGLQLWDYQGRRGLWSHGNAMDGDRYLAPLSENQWHDVLIHFKASSTGAGFYRVYVDGQLVDSRDGVSVIRPDRSSGYIKTGLYRNGDEIPGTSDIRIDAARLGTTQASVTG
ncbi:MAG TPA: heparin lyase I family protein [Thermoleophilaceae bacterium]|nr:heparin lyase I family protein [Thermoleophilaceae bacterium]